MAITASNLINNILNSAATSYNTASISPVANRLTLVTVGSQFAGTSNVPTVTGASGTWVNIISAADATNNRRMSIFRDLSASPGSGALTIDFAGQSQANCEWSVEQLDGIDLSGTHGSGAIVQSASNTLTNGGATTGITVSLSALGSANNATYGGVRANGASAIVAGTGFTELSTNATVRMETEWKINDNSVLWTWASQLVISIAVAIEIKAAVPAAFLPPGNRMLGWNYG